MRLAVVLLRLIEERQEHPLAGVGVEVDRAREPGLDEARRLGVHRDVAEDLVRRALDDRQVDLQGRDDDPGRDAIGRDRRRGGRLERAGRRDRRQGDRRCRCRRRRGGDDDLRGVGIRRGLDRAGVREEPAGDQGHTEWRSGRPAGVDCEARRTCSRERHATSGGRDPPPDARTGTLPAHGVPAVHPCRPVGRSARRGRVAARVRLHGSRSGPPVGVGGRGIARPSRAVDRAADRAVDRAVGSAPPSPLAIGAHAPVPSAPPPVGVRRPGGRPGSSAGSRGHALARASITATLRRDPRR